MGEYVARAVSHDQRGNAAPSSPPPHDAPPVPLGEPYAPPGKVHRGLEWGALRPSEGRPAPL